MTNKLTDLTGTPHQQLEAAAQHIERKAADYDAEHGVTDPETGHREYPGDGADYYDEMMELAEEIRGLAVPQEPALAPKSFADWMLREMPAGTVIGDPNWWARRIIKAVESSTEFSCPQTGGLALIAAERQRQLDVEGWSPEHDDRYQESELAAAAACYALASVLDEADKRRGGWFSFWPWTPSWWKPTTAERDLAKAGALCAAELDRRLRAAQPTDEAPGHD